MPPYELQYSWWFISMTLYIEPEKKTQSNELDVARCYIVNTKYFQLAWYAGALKYQIQITWQIVTVAYVLVRLSLLVCTYLSVLYWAVDMQR